MAVAVGDQRRRKEAMELLVTEIAKGDDEHIAPNLRTAVERGWLQSFLDILQEAKKKKDSEIDRICSRHYADFLNSVGDMLNMQDAIKELKGSIGAVHQKFNSTGGDLVRVLENLNRIQAERDHTRKALEAALICKDIAQLMVDVRKQIESDDYYTAMRTIEAIQHEVNNPILAPIQPCLQKWLPVTINKLLYGVRAEADVFIAQLRSAVPLLGATILVRQAKLSSNSDGLKALSAPSSSSVGHRRYSTLSPVKGGAAGEGLDLSLLPDQLTITLKYLLSNPAAFHLDAQYCKPVSFENFISTHFKQAASPEGLEMLDYRLSDMSALHKVYHLYAVLGQVQHFLAHYEAMRTAHFQSILKQFDFDINHSKNQDGLIGSLPRYIEQLTGFFTVECVVARIIENNTQQQISLHDSASIFSHAEFSRLWREAMEHLDRTLRAMAITLTSPDMLIQIKEELVLLLHTMTDDMYNFNCTNLVHMVLSLFEMFEALQVQLLTQNAVAAMEKCAYQPYFVSSHDAYAGNIKPYQLDRIEIDQEIFLHHGAAGAQSIEQKGQQQRALIQHLDANLDALEEEIGLHPGAGVGVVGGHSAAGAANSLTLPARGAATVSGVGSASSVPASGSLSAPGGAFMAQTYPFSEFVPSICKELHAALMRTMMYLFVKPPETLVMMLNNSTMTAVYSNSSSVAAGAGGARKMFSEAAQAHMNEERLKACEALVITLSHTNFVQLISQSMYRYFEVVAGQMQKELRKDGLETALSKACQISIDAAALALSCEHLWGILEQALQHCFGFHALQSNSSANGSGLAASSPMPSPSKLMLAAASAGRPGKTSAQPAVSAQPAPSSQQGAQFFQIYDDVIALLRGLTSQAQDLIFELLSNKIEGLLESLVFIDYEPSTLVGGSANNAHQNINLHSANTQFVHECVESIVEFLTITFMWLTHLPQTIRESIHFISCSKVSMGILHYLLDRVQHLNVFALIALDADVKRLVQFADSCGTPHLRSCFEELSQLVRLLLHPDLPQLMENSGLRRHHFPLAATNKLAALMDKMMPSPAVALSSNLPRMDKNTTRAWAKKLRAQAQRDE